MKKSKFNVSPSSPFDLRKSKAGKKDQQRVKTECRNFLTSEELAKFESVDVSDDPILEEYQSFFMEQVFSAAHDEDMVSTYELSAYRNSIAELLFRADIVRDSKPKASYIADLGFRTSNKVFSEFHFVDYELSNAE